MSIVDAHHHLWDPEVGHYPWMTGDYAALRRRYDLDDLIPHLDVNDVAATFVVQVRADLERYFSRLVPDGDPLFLHDTEGPDDMPAHVRAALTGASLAIPFSRAGLQLGTWQGIYLWEHRMHPHQRQVVVTLSGYMQPPNDNQAG